MRTILLSILLVFFLQISFTAVNVNESRIHKSSEVLDIQPQEIEPQAPGRISSFWWSFVLSAIGAYTLYGLAVGPISVLIVFWASKRNKSEVRKSLWGWILGTIFGISLFVLFKLL